MAKEYTSFDNDEPLLAAQSKPTYKDVVLMVAAIFNRNSIDADPAWFVGHLLEGENPFEKPDMKNIAGSKDSAFRWEYPYQLRVKSCAAAWVRMSLPDREVIIAGREDDIYWRGEDVDFYMTVYRETETMRKDVPAYIARMKHKVSELNMGAL